MSEDTQAVLDKIAIVGISARFPQAKNKDEFWENLCNGVEAITFFDKKTAIEAGADEDEVNNPFYVCAAGKLDDVDLFDPDFFGFTPKEAEIMDPQQRLFFECAYEALEDAGYAKNIYNEPVGVYAGANTSTYFLYHLLDKAGIHANLGMAIGNDKDYLATRFSYALNLKGPSVTVQTSCSTSLTAIAAACDGLLNYHCDAAIAGGVSINLPQELGYMYQEGMILSPDGHCRPFDEKAQGTIFTNGAAAVVLKRYEDAVNDNDRIYAVIRSFAINNDGADKIGYTAPSREGQASVIAVAQSLADINPEDITYIETHGTGTSLGDPIEIEALTKVFRETTDKKQFCAVGSVKSNIGHAISAAGVASIIKTALAIKNKKIPPTINYEKPNPKIDFENSPFYVNNKLINWQPDGKKRIAGVSSFGIGGTNIHIILEDADEINDSIKEETQNNQSNYQLLTLSAQNETSLLSNINNLINHIDNTPDLNLSNTAFTLNKGRKSLEYRSSIIFQDKTDLLNELNDLVNKKNFTRLNNTDISFALLTGDLNILLDRSLISDKTVLQNEIIECIGLIQKHDPDFDFDKTYDKYLEHKTTEIENNLLQLLVSNVIVVYLKNLDIEPDYMIGSGIGELQAMVCSGIITIDEGISVILQNEAERSELISSFDFSLEDKIYFSSITGNWITIENLKDPDYWDKVLKNEIIKSDSLDKLLLLENVLFINLNFDESNTSIKSPEISSFYNTEHVIDIQSLYQALGKIWSNGFNINWENYYKSGNNSIVSLPYYAFDRKKYWIDPYNMKLITSQAGKKNNKKTEKKTEYNAENWLYSPVWKYSPFQSVDISKCQGTWILFINDIEFTNKLCSYLKNLGVNVISVKQDSEYIKIDQNTYKINAGSKDDYQNLINDILENHSDLSNILHLWCTNNETLDITRLEYAKKCETNGFLSLLYLAQALYTKNFDKKLRLGVVTNNLYSIAGENCLYPEHALVLGPAKVITREFQDVVSQGIDITFPVPGSIFETDLIEAILGEITGENINLNTALRNNKRWYLDYQQIDIPQDNATQILKENNVYLITGGLGGIGLELAGYIAGKVKSTLVLTRRSLFPPEDQWNDYLEKNNEQDKTCKIIKKLKKIQDTGSTVKIINVDVTDYENMKKSIDTIEKETGKINGIFHAAGVVDNGVIKDKKIDTAIKVFNPKVTGTIILNKIFKDRKPDFIVLFSSSSAILGNVGFVDYCSANGFLDSFAQYSNNETGLFTIAVNWDEWSNLGMSEGSNFSQVIKNKITPEKALPLLMDIIVSKVYPQAIVSAGNFNDMLNNINEFLKSSIGIKSNEQNINTENNRPDLDTPFTAPSSETEISLTEIWEDLLGINPIGVNDDFFDLGGHSLLATTLISEIGKKFKINIELNELFNRSTISDLSELIDEELIDDDKIDDIVYEEGII